MKGLFATTGTDQLSAASDWITGLLLGPLTTTLAVLAVATIGALMLRGHISLRHASQVLLGCFLLFGAGTLANSFRALADYGGGSSSSTAQPAQPPPLLDAEPTQNVTYDPYAGAAVRYN